MYLFLAEKKVRMNRLKILEIKRRRYEEKQQKALANATLRSPNEHLITYVLSEFFELYIDWFAIYLGFLIHYGSR